MSIVFEADNISKTFRVYDRQPTIFRLVGQIFRRAERGREFPALHTLSLRAQAGDRLAIVGRNGAGKTTLLRILAGIYRPSGGTLRINEKRAAFFGSAGLSGNLTVSDNIYLTGALYGMSRSSVKQKIDEILDFSELADYRNHVTRELSWGQSKRLLLSIFIQNSCPVLFFDEAFNGLDGKFLERLESAFSVLFRDKTVVMASHDNDFLLKYCRRAVWLDHGRLIEDGPMAAVLSRYSGADAASS